MSRRWFRWQVSSRCTRIAPVRFRLKASNGQVVATGEAYKTKAAAKKGCESVRKAADGAPVIETDSSRSPLAGTERCRWVSD
ncbi:YegP family protein [Pseudonocardia sp. MH-G8]|uniref:YegP family protein n=1 Tax=Pseudonocardia sp. MH-G8 TaxID=1854588 RepID=UPI001E5D1F9B|nr:YegP family protein [Pseudonocardia sp. MH-G8]